MNFHLKNILLVLLLASTAACSQVIRVDPDNPVEVSEEVTVERDEFKGATYYQGPVITNEAEDDRDSPEVEDIALRAVTPRDEPTRFFLTITDYYDGDWRGFDQVFDLSGKKFHALSVRHKVNCVLFCGYEEVLEIQLPRAYLDDHAKTGISMRMYGPSGAASAPFTLPAGYIQGFLKGSFSEK